MPRATLATKRTRLYDPVSAKRNHLKHGQKGGRFDPVMLANRIERFRAMVGVEPKDVAAAVFPNQDRDNATRSWYKRANQHRAPFQLGEIEVAVDYLLAEGRKKGSVPADVRLLHGFPFIEYADAVKVERGK
jgi:hypothetical protein